MDEEEFAANEVWFGNHFRLTESQELEFIGDTSPVDDVATEEVVEPAVAAVEATALQDPLPFPMDIPTGLPMELQESPAIPESPGEVEEDPELLLKPKAKRDTISYAKKMILAGPDLFLDTLYADKLNDTEVKLTGQIKECPRASNGKRYCLEWKEPLPSGID
jgi:hypothetical protein